MNGVVARLVFKLIENKYKYFVYNFKKLLYVYFADVRLLFTMIIETMLAKSDDSQESILKAHTDGSV